MVENDRIAELREQRAHVERQIDRTLQLMRSTFLEESVTLVQVGGDRTNEEFRKVDDRFEDNSRRYRELEVSLAELDRSIVELEREERATRALACGSAVEDSAGMPVTEAWGAFLGKVMGALVAQGVSPDSPDVTVSIAGRLLVSGASVTPMRSAVSETPVMASSATPMPPADIEVTDESDGSDEIRFVVEE